MELRKETERELKKLQKEVKTIRITGKLDKKQTEEVLENLRAYIQDCQHFAKNRDWVRAFEAIVYAWGIYETCLRIGLIKK